MGFSIVESPVRYVWSYVDNADRSTWPTLRIGQLVYQVSDGVGNLGQASGAADTSGKKIPFGVVIGTNHRNTSYDTTYKTDSITAYDPHSNSVERVLGEGHIASRGDRSAMVQVAVIGPNTVLKGKIFKTSFGTAPDVSTVTTGSTTGAGFSGGAGSFTTPVADLCSVYCRTGANQGMYRVTTDTSATVKTVGHYFPYDIAIGDKFVQVPMRPQGKSYVQTDAQAMFIDAAANPATNYWIINVLELDLSVAGMEHVKFQFNADHFTAARA